MNVIVSVLLCFVATVKADVLSDISESGRCSNTDTCPFHVLTCRSYNDLIVFHSAVYGYTQDDDDSEDCAWNFCQKQNLCCNRYARHFCTAGFGFDDLVKLTWTCTGKHSCLFRSPENVKRYNVCPYYNRQAVSTFLKYSCVSSANIFDTRYNRSAISVDSASIQINGSQFDLLRPHSAVCHIDSASRFRVSVTLYSMSVLSQLGVGWTVTIRSRSSFYNLNAQWFEDYRLQSPMMARRITSLDTPITVNITIPRYSHPDLFWIWFEGEMSRFNIECTTTCADCYTATTVKPTTTTTTAATTTTTTTASATRSTATSTKQTIPPQKPTTIFSGILTSAASHTGNISEAGNGTVAIGFNKTQEKAESKNWTGVIVGSVVTAVVLVGFVATVFLLCRRRRQQRKAEQARRQGALPSRSTLGDDGYCVPVISASGVSWGMHNSAYVSDGADSNSAETVHKEWAAVVNNGKANGHVKDASRIRNGSFKHHSSDENFGEVGEIYEDVNDSGNEDTESGIDDDSYDSEFEDYDEDPSAFLRHPGQIDGNDEGRGNEHVVSEQVYFELEPDYYNSSFTQQNLDSSESSHPVSHVPEHTLPPEPKRKGLMGRIRKGAHNARQRIRGLVPKRERFALENKDAPQSSTEENFRRPGTTSSGLTNAGNTDTVTSEYSKRELPVLPGKMEVTPDGVTSIFPGSTSAVGERKVRKIDEADPGTAGTDVYLTAKPIEIDDKTEETSFSTKCDSKRLKSLAMQDGQQTQNIQSQMPHILIAELKNRAQARKPVSAETVSFKSQAKASGGQESVNNQTNGHNLKVLKRSNDGYTKVMKPRKEEANSFN